MAGLQPGIQLCSGTSPRMKTPVAECNSSLRFGETALRVWRRREIFLHQPQFAVARRREQQRVEQLGKAVHARPPVMPPGGKRPSIYRADGTGMLSLGPNFARADMIHHLSIAARAPKQAAGVLAELMGGTAVPFPPNPGSFFALQLDDHGSGVEVYPAGTELEPNGDVGGTFAKHERER